MRNTTLVLAALALTLLAPLALASSRVDFEGLAEGTIVGTVAHGSGISGDPVAGSIGIVGNSPRLSGNTAILFDATCTPICSGEDTDLRFPAQGNILIIAEDLVDTSPADGLIDDPDDADRIGQNFVFDYSTLGNGRVRVERMTVLDIEGVESGGRIDLFDGPSQITSIPIPVTGNHASGVAPVGVSGVSRMVVLMNGSGAIDNVEIDATYCGDGTVKTPEECDDGNDDDTDACRNDCTLPACGDGVVQPGEQCDDGNQNDADACTNACTVPICGDGIVHPGEQCDDGNQSDADGCTNACTVPICGDGIVQAGESCDDGNQSDGDGCSSICQPELSAPKPLDRVCKHPCPAKLTVRNNRPDLIRFQLRFMPSLPFDPSTTSFRMVLSNPSGPIYAADLVAGDFVHQGKKWQFRDGGAARGVGIRDGLSNLTVLPIKGGTSFRINFRAYGDLAPATEPEMTIRLEFGDEAFQRTDIWEQTKRGWQVRMD